MPKKRNEKYFIKGHFNYAIYLKDWRIKHPDYHARKAQEFRERHFYSKGLTAAGKKRKNVNYQKGGKTPPERS